MEHEIQLLDLAHAAVCETLATGGPVGGMLGQFTALLTEGPWLIWRGDGPGIGRELRRSFSNIHGRYFARCYLETSEDVLGLLPIEGKEMRIDNSIVVRKKPGSVGDMPDWIGWTDNGLIIAEAKGSYAGGDWRKSLSEGGNLPQPLQKAQEQIERVRIDYPDQAADLNYKGWAVATRWATEKSGQEPWLVALDPKLGTTTPSEEQFRTICAAMQRHLLNTALVSMRFLDRDSTTAETIDESSVDDRFSFPQDSIFQIQLDGRQPWAGLHALVGPFGFVPIRTEKDIGRLSRFRKLLGPFFLVTVSDTYLKAAIKDQFLQDFERPESDDTQAIRNGFVLTYVDPSARILLSG